MHVDRVITPELECSCVDKTYEELTNYEAHDTCMYVRECKSLLEYVLGHGSANVEHSHRACAVRLVRRGGKQHVHGMRTTVVHARCARLQEWSRLPCPVS